MIPRRLLCAAAASAVAAAAAGCGGGQAAPPPHAFAWISGPSPAADWPRASVGSGGASIAYPPGWHRTVSDPGTATATLSGPHGEIAGYLNLTPAEGSEDPVGWARFRLGHNRDEGDTQVRRIAAAEGLRFHSGGGSCVIDTYRTARSAYDEIACIVDGSRATSVVVGAMPPRLWSREAPTLERAIAGVST